MILSALAGLYDRLSKAEPESMPRPGWNRRNVSFALVLDAEGRAVRLADLRRPEGKKLLSLSLLVPDHGETRTSGAKNQPYFLCDGTAFLLGASANMDTPKAGEYFTNARALHDRLLAGCGDSFARAVLAHFATWTPDALPALLERSEGVDWDKEVSGQNLVFALEDEPGWAHQRPALADLWNRDFAARSPSPLGQCLVSGEIRPIARLHAGIKLPGTVGNGAPVISFNSDAFTSYGHSYHGMNAPVSEAVTFAYTAALNTLVARDSRRRMALGETIVVFWAEGAADAEELALAQMMGLDGDDPGLDEAAAQRVGTLLSALSLGVPGTDGLKDLGVRGTDGLKDLGLDPTVTFYILGIAAPGGSRVSVRFWHVSNFGELVKRVLRHHQAMAIEKRHPKDADYPTLRDCLRAAVPLGKDDNIPGPLAAVLARAVLLGTPYPPALLALTLARMGREHGPYDSVSTLRARLVKACLTRSCPDWSPTVSLNPDDTDTAYRLGRLFAALERTQQMAQGMAVNATIKDRYFAAASSSPRAVFPNLIRLAQHHLSKAEKSGWLDGLIGTIVDAIGDFPATLTLEQQGRFALGYYHQRNDLWKSRKTAPEPETAPTPTPES